MSDLNTDSKKDNDPVDVLKEVTDLPVQENDINLNLDNEENDEVSTSQSSLNYLELIKNILFRILDIIYNRFFDVVNDFNSVYKESIEKLN